MAIINNMGIWGTDEQYGNWASSTRPDTNGRISGFTGDRFVYANQVNYALKCSSLLPYVFSSILENSSISSSYNFDINPENINASNISTFKTQMTNAINSYIASIKVVNATNADNATNAVKATQDESANNIKDSYGASLAGNNSALISLINKNGYALSSITVNNVANATYANKLGSSTLGSTTKPIYLSSGTATECSKYAGATKVTLNGTNKGANDASFYAPTSSGTAGQMLISGGSGTAPSWTTAPKTLYKHQVSLAPSSALYGRVKIDFYSNKSDGYDLSSLKSYLLTQQAGVQGFIYQKAVGEIWAGQGSTVHYLVVGVYCSDATSHPIYPIIWDGNSIRTYNLPIYELTQLSSTQTVTQLT